MYASIASINNTNRRVMMKQSELCRIYYARHGKGLQLNRQWNSAIKMAKSAKENLIML